MQLGIISILSDMFTFCSLVWLLKYMKTRLKSFKIIESQYVNPLDKLKQLSLHKQHTGQFTAGLNPNISCFYV